MKKTVLLICLTWMGCMNGAVVNLDAGGGDSGDDLADTVVDGGNENLGPQPGPGIYSHDVLNAVGDLVTMGQFTGKVTLIVNVASRCGYTPQYEGLQDLHEAYNERGFSVIGFPANNFADQEPGSDEEIQEFCTVTYGTTFPVYAKISVKGEDKHPLYAGLTEESGEEFQGEVNWNFEKFLVNGQGLVVGRFRSGVAPQDAQITNALDALLAP